MAQRGRAAAACCRPLGWGQNDQRRALYANCKVLISPVSEYLLPSCWFWWPGLWRLYALETVLPQIFAISVQLTWPGQLGEFGRGGGVRESAATHGDTRSMELIADGGPMNGQLRTDLA